MPEGGVTGSITAGGGPAPANGQQQARQIAILGVSPGGTVNTIFQPGSQGGAQLLCDTGPLLEEATLLYPAGGPPPLLVPVMPSSAGAVSEDGVMVANPANLGTGTLTATIAPHRSIRILCTTSGAIGTMKVKFSFDGGVTYGPITPSVDSGGGAWIYLVPGTFTTITFAAANYVATKIATIGVDGSITYGAAWVGVVSFVASPIDTYELLITCVVGGLFSTGAASISISLDNGFSKAGVFQIPASGVVVVTDGHGNGTGLVLTAAATFTAGDSYTGLAVPPSFSTSDVTAAITAMIASANRPTVCAIHVNILPSSAASAFSLAQTLDAALATAFAAGLDWQGFVECPVVNDVTIDPADADAVILDAADTDSVIRTARAGITTNRVAVCASTGGMISPITGIRTRRPFGWALMQRYAGTDPRQSLGGNIGGAPLGSLPSGGGPGFSIGRDEKLAAIQLADLQVNVPTTYDGYPGGAYLTITSGGFALKNLTLVALYQDAETMRVLNVVSARVRVIGVSVLADRPAVNADNTIAETAAKDYDTLFDTGVKRAAGLLVGGAFGNTPQVTSVSASIDRTSVLGASPRQLKVNVPFKGLGMISAVSYTIAVQGA